MLTLISQPSNEQLLVTITTDMSARSFESGFFLRVPAAQQRRMARTSARSSTFALALRTQLEQRLQYLCCDDRLAWKGCDKVAVAVRTVLLNKLFQDSNGIDAFSGNSLLVPQQKKRWLVCKCEHFLWELGKTDGQHLSGFKHLPLHALLLIALVSLAE